jgi:Tol biopolymer transport system component
VAFSGGRANVFQQGPQIYLRDRQRRQTSLVSVAAAGGQPDAASSNPSISAGGRFVAFRSDATDLVTGDTNGQPDIFVRDRLAGTTTRLSVSSSETQADGPSDFPSISANGRFVTFVSRAANLGTDSGTFNDVFLRDLEAGTTVRVSHGVGGAEPNADSPAAAISGDGTTVVFISLATNLVADDTNGFADVFAYDRATGAVRRVNLTPSGAQANGHTLTSPGAPATDFDGSVVAFGTNARNLLGGPAEYDFVARDLIANTVQRLSSHAQLDNLYEEAESPGPSVSADGRRIAFAGIGSQLPGYLGASAMDVVVRDRLSGRVTRISQLSQCVPAEEINGYPAISANGRWVAFQSNAVSLLLPGVYQGGVSPPMHVYVASALPVRGTEVCRIAVFPRNNDPATNSRFRLVLSKAGRATISIYRKRAGRRLVRRRTLSRTGLAAGLNSIRFSLRGLGAGSYVAVARGSARGSPARRASFTIRRP